MRAIVTSRDLGLRRGADDASRGIEDEEPARIELQRDLRARVELADAVGEHDQRLSRDDDMDVALRPGDLANQDSAMQPDGVAAQFAERGLMGAKADRIIAVGEIGESVRRWDRAASRERDHRSGFYGGDRVER